MRRRVFLTLVAVISLSVVLRACQPSAPNAGELAPVAVTIVDQAPPGPEGPQFVTLNCEASHPNKSAVMFVGYRADSFSPPIPKGHISPIYMLQFQRDGKWEQHPVGWCGTGMDGIELPPGETKKFHVMFPADTVGKTVRIGIQWSKPQNFATAGPEAFQVSWSKPFVVEARQ
jgi:hypothetical protein